MDLAEFLLARIAEDEALAEEAAPAPWEAVTDDHSDVIEHSVWSGGIATGYYLSERLDQPSADHIARWDPARVLAECAAKRRIVELHERAPWTLSGDAVCGHDETRWPCTDLRLLAAIYADHPDYRPEWAPTVAA